MQVAAASALLAAFLIWGAQQWDWKALQAHEWQRAGLMAVMLAGSAVIYFGALRASGVKLRSLLRR